MKSASPLGWRIGRTLTPAEVSGYWTDKALTFITSQPGAWLRLQARKVVLLDEPTSALDPISTSRIEELVIELKNDFTIVIVTHNMQQAARISDYTAYMYLGELIEYGVTDELFLRPKKKETEDYITGRFG